MKKISFMAVVALAIVTPLAGCSSDLGVPTQSPLPPPPPAPPLVWNQANWDEVLWQ